MLLFVLQNIMVTILLSITQFAKEYTTRTTILLSLFKRTDEFIVSDRPS